MGLNEQTVLGKKTSKEHSVPVLVGTFMSEALDSLGAAHWIAPVAELTAMGSEAIAQCPLFYRHGTVWLMVMHGEGLQSHLRPCLRSLPRPDDYPLKLISELSLQNTHDLTPSADYHGPVLDLFDELPLVLC
jgi:hypothetical protein